MTTGKCLEELYNIYKEHPRIATDSRSAGAGMLFFALKGASFDGNKFAGAALDAGAALAVIDDESVMAEYAASHPGANVSLLFFPTDNVLETLQALAAHHRRTLGIPILAITGTNGKTTTKELVTAVTAKKYNVYSTRGNLNNHIGVPLTLLSMTKETQFGVVEMGASARGEIGLLSRIAAPDFGLVTNIGRAHLEGFGGEEGVRAGKGELYDYLNATGGMAIVRSDDPVLAEMASERHGMKIEDYDLHYADGIASRLAGDYNRANIAAAVAVGRMLGITDEDIKEAIYNYEPDNNRSQLIDTGRNVVLADCYNANPSSMAAAIENFASAKHMAGKQEKHGAVLQKTAILGDMMELGEWSAAEHEKIAAMALASGIGHIIFVGANFSEAVRRLIGGESLQTQFVLETHRVHGMLHVETLPDTGKLKEYLSTATLRNNLILLKGSRSMRLEEAIGAM